MHPSIIAQTNDYFVINKPAGMAVEPPSHCTTIKNWMVENNYINPADWQPAERFGVVHRLDTDTSGVLVWAKNPSAQSQLKNLWQGRQVEKTYIALVTGECDSAGEIDLPIERDNKNDKMRVVLLNTGKARPAITTYKRLAVTEYNGKKVSLIEAHPVTGRTHQIRVHMKSRQHPIIGDKLYGEKATELLAKELGIKRHFLHALQICLIWNNEKVCYESPLPEDLAKCLKELNINFN